MRSMSAVVSLSSCIKNLVLSDVNYLLMIENWQIIE